MKRTILKNFINPVILVNTDDYQNMGDSSFDTKDLIFLDSLDRAAANSKDSRKISPTDYALANGAYHYWNGYVAIGKRGRSFQWLRTANNTTGVYAIDGNGDFGDILVIDTTCTLCPVLQLNLSAVISAKKTSKDLFKIDRVIDKNSGNVAYHTIKFGEYPKSYVGGALNATLERSYNYEDGLLRLTGKQYTGHIKEDGEIIYHQEFEYCGNKYVRVEVKRYEEGNFYEDGTLLKKGDHNWIKVEPISWIIRNWEDMPVSINPNGTGRARFIDVKTEEGIATLPFYAGDHCEDSNVSFWQNSTIRGYLNGINVNNIITNGNVNYQAPNGGDFSRYNFLTEALCIDMEHSLQQEEDLPKRKPRKGYGVKVLDKPMTVNEQIKFYMDNGKSFMLHGPSGVGKTRRIEEADPDFVSIVLRNGILPEEVIGKTIYPNNDKTKSGTWVPPAWYVDLCEKCEREPDKQHVLFIDEITNVKPSEQSLVFHLVLNNSIGPNIGKLPQNVVVAAAGNSKEESEAAYNMPEPLFRRFDGHIELRPDVHLWLEWGSEQSDKGEGRLKVHPLVANFVGTYGSQVFYSPYDSEDPPKYAIDPRGWEQVSDIIYDNNGLIAQELIKNKVGKEIAATFVAFAQNPPLMIEDVIDKNYDYTDIPDGFDAKYALALSLRSANFDEIQSVREFISNELGSEILSMFDSVWVGDDNEKAIHLQSLPEIKDTVLKNKIAEDYENDGDELLPF